MMFHTTIDSFFEINFSLMHHHKWSLSDIESMIPFEREVYVKLLANALEKQRLEIQNQQNG
tara:strand:- start:668 stop:850 length:183 start_codon:yes stop_codon:yes gene_type:complete